MANSGDGDAEIDFVSLGMFIIDEIEFKPPIPPVRDVLGGAGTYSAIGARIVSPPPLSRRVGWIVDAGSDFPAELRDTIKTWKTSCLIRETPNRLTTRGWNGYGENEYRAFKYTTPKLRLDHNSLDEKLLLSKSFHLICSPERAIDLVVNILKRRETLHHPRGAQRPLFIWEPVPDLCTPAQLDNCRRALRYVDIISPNHVELCAFFGADGHTPDGSIATDIIEHCCRDLLESQGKDSNFKGVIVRAGKDGCFIATTEDSTWTPAYHRESTKVVDPTGGGNTFLGGFSITLARSARIDFECIKDAVIHGAVAASFAIEQIGMPKLEEHDDHESWNGDSVQKRIDDLRNR